MSDFSISEENIASSNNEFDDDKCCYCDESGHQSKDCPKKTKANRQADEYEELEKGQIPEADAYSNNSRAPSRPRRQSNYGGDEYPARDRPQGGNSNACWKFQSGNCTFGDRCRFDHEGGNNSNAPQRRDNRGEARYERPPRRDDGYKQDDSYKRDDTYKRREDVRKDDYRRDDGNKQDDSYKRDDPYKRRDDRRPTGIKKSRRRDDRSPSSEETSEGVLEYKVQILKMKIEIKRLRKKLNRKVGEIDHLKSLLKEKKLKDY